MLWPDCIQELAVLWQVHLLSRWSGWSSSSEAARALCGTHRC